MLIYLTPIGSGKTLKTPIGNSKYSGIIAIAQHSKKYNLNYKGKCELSQDKLFNLIYNDSNYKIKKLITIHSEQNLYKIGRTLLTELTSLIKKHPSIKFHIEISAGYKELSHILVLISQIISKNIEKITFTRWDKTPQQFPITQINITKQQLEILKGFKKGLKSTTWSGKIISNPYVTSNIKNRKYIYRILKKSKTQGLLKPDNTFTDFGKLILKFYKL